MKKLTKIANKPTKSMKNAGTLRGVRAHTPKNHEKTLKIEVFASFCTEFKLKYYKKSSKIIMFYY
jgi:hypothetical protein